MADGREWARLVRRLAGLEHSLKGKDRLTEKVEKWLSAQPDLRLDDAFKLVKDGIRYTFVVHSGVKHNLGVYNELSGRAMIEHVSRELARNR